MNADALSPLSPDEPVAWQNQGRLYGLPLFGHRTCLNQIRENHQVVLVSRGLGENAPATCAACGRPLSPPTLIPLSADSLEELVARLTTGAAQQVALHHRYITDAWGTFGLTGETYRFRADRDWRQAQTALLHLQQQASVQPALLNRTDLETVSACTQGMHIRLFQYFSETPDDPAGETDKAESARLWKQVQGLNVALYRRLG